MSGLRGTLGGRLTTVLVSTGVLSTLVLAAVVLALFQDRLASRAEAQLASIRDDRTAAVERALGELAATTSAFAAEPGVVAAFADMAGAWTTLGPDLTAAERADLAGTLADEVASLPAEVVAPRPDPAALVAGSVAGRRAQELYIARNPAPDERALLDDAGDDSAWTRAHAASHPYLRELVTEGVASDLLFVSADGLEVVYSVAKNPDFGTDLDDGPWRDSGLAAVVAQLPQLAAGGTAVVDSGFHPPAGEAPTLFLASGVLSGSQVLGALVLAVPIEDLTDFVTADGDWDRLGLGDTGEVYVVGGDGTLRTEPRGWREDPDDWLARRADTGAAGAETAALVARIGSPVHVAVAAADAVAAAADGRAVVQQGDGLLGDPSLVAASSVDATGLDWVLVAEQARSETSASAARFLRSLGLLLLVLVPLITAVGLLTARSLTRPHGPVIEASAALAAGRVDIDLPDLGNNELGDLARQLEEVADEIRTRRRVIDDEDRRIEDLLSAVVPPRLMDQVRAGERGLADVLETATVVAVTLVGVPDVASVGEDVVVDFTDRVARSLERAAAAHGLETVTVSSSQERFLAGHGRPGTQADAAARFATAAADIVRATGRELGLSADARIGMAAGQVATGLLGSSQAAFAVWGDPPALAATLDSLAQPGEVLVDAVVATELDGSDEWRVDRLEDAVGLDDEPIEAWRLTPATTVPSTVGGPPIV